MNPGIVGKFFGAYALGILVAAWVLRKVLRPGFTANLGRLDVTLLTLIVGAAAISALVSLSPLTITGHSKHHEGILAFLFYGLIYLLAADEESPINSHSLSAVVSAAVILNLLIGVLPSEQKYSLALGGRFLGSFAEPNFLAGFLVLSIPLTAIIALEGRTVFSRLLGSAALVSGIAQLLMSESRSGYVALAVAVLVFSLAAYTQSAGRWRKAYLAAPGLFMLGALLLTRFSASRLWEGTLQRYGSWGSIRDTWGYLLIGPGPGRFQYATQNRYLALGPHNAYIDYAGNIGWLAAIAYILLIALAIYRLVASIKQSKKGESLATSLVLAGIAGYIFFSFATYTRVSVNMLFWMLLGIAAGTAKQTRAINLSSKTRTLVAVPLVLSIVIAAGASILIAAGGWQARLGLQAENDITKWNRLSAAIRYEPWNVDYHVVRGNLAIKFAELAGQDGLTEEVLERAIEDWAFLYQVAHGSNMAYENLDFFYFLANVPAVDRIEPPTGYMPQSAQ